MKKLLITTLFLILCAVLSATTIFTEEKTCAVCGAKNSYNVIGSTNSMGSSDLDLRPPEMMRSTIGFWVEKCPACGYCASDVSQLLKNAKETVTDPAYMVQLVNPDFPELANKFLSRMMIEDKAGERRAAVYSAICAGWASDDAKALSAAIAARKLGIQRILEMNATNEQYAQQNGGDELLIVDMYRRNEEFAQAEQFIKKGLKLETEDIIKTILNFQRGLIEKKDTSVYTISEAVNTE